MVFFLIPILAGIGGWLATAGLGSILSVLGFTFVMSWLVGHIIIPLGIVLGLLTTGFIMVYFGAREEGVTKWGNWKFWGGAISIIFGLMTFSNFFLNYKIIPGVFSVAMPATSLSITQGLAPSSAIFEVIPPFNWVIIFLSLYAIYRVVKKKR